MKEFVFNKALGQNFCPFANNRKEIAPAVAAGLIAGGASLLGGVASSYMNLKSQADTNAANKEINREQLAAQRYLYDQQRADERFLVNQAYERNLPKNQVKNLREAGINPAFAMQNGSFGVQQAQVGSAPSAPSVSSPIPQQAMDYSGFGLAASNAGNIIANGIAAAKDSERQDYALANDITVSRMNAHTNFMNAVTKAKEAGVNEEWIKSQISDAERNYWLNVDRSTVEKENRDREIKVQERTNEIRQYEAETGRMLANANIRVSSATISKIAQEIVESKERVTQMVMDGESKRSVEAWIHDKEMYLARELKVQCETVERNAKNHPLIIYQDIIGSLLNPFKGIISVGGKF